MIYLALQADWNLPVPRTMEELLVYILFGIVSFAFGHLKWRQTHNSDEIKRLKTQMRLFCTNFETQDDREKKTKTRPPLDRP